MDYRKIYKRLKENGVPEDKITVYKRFLDCEKKRCKRDRLAKQKAGIVFNSIEAMVSEEMNYGYEIPDPSQDVLGKLVHECDLEILRKSLKCLKPDEMYLLWIYFGIEDEVSARAARTLGIPVSTFKDRRNKAMEKLRKEFFKNSQQ